MSDSVKGDRELPTPKFSFGQRVFAVETSRTVGQRECPDCHGTRKWSCKSPAGVQLEMDCPRCTRSGGWGDSLSLNFVKYVFSARQLTIGSVQIDTANSERPVSYMCVETGVGSGTIYPEWALYETEESALREAQAKAAVAQANEDAKPQAMKSAAYGRLGYFEALREGMRAEIEQQVRESLKGDLPASDSGRTQGAWRARGEYGDDGVFRFDVDAVDVSTGKRLGVCSGYGGLSMHFASREEGPANARLIAAAPAMHDYIQSRASDGDDEAQSILDAIREGEREEEPA